MPFGSSNVLFNYSQLASIYNSIFSQSSEPKITAALAIKITISPIVNNSNGNFNAFDLISPY